MGMSTRTTNAANLQKAIDEKIITIINAKIESKDDHKTRTISPEKFKEDLDFYLESGIFADSIDFKYELSENDLTVYAGNMSNYCDSCIMVELIVNDDVMNDDLEKILRKVDEM